MFFNSIEGKTKKTPLKMTDVLETLALMVLGASCLLFIQGMFQSITVFNSKRSRMFVLCICGLISGILQCILVTSGLYWGVNGHVIAIVATPFWYLMIQSASWVYCIRIQSLGVRSSQDKYVRYIPWVILVLQIPANVLYIMASFDKRYFNLNVIIGTIFSVFIALFEIYLFIVLLLKVVNVLEYRRRVKNLLIYEIVVSLVLLIFLDTALIIAKVANWKFDLILRPFTYLLRIVIVIRFFEDLLDGLKLATDASPKPIDSLELHSDFQLVAAETGDAFKNEPDEL